MNSILAENQLECSAYQISTISSYADEGIPGRVDTRVDSLPALD